jgi:NADPH-dependent curcumin reductase CurA
MPIPSGDADLAVVVKRLPHGEPTPSDFEVRSLPVPELAEGDALVRTLYLSIDPYQRGRLRPGPSYAPGVNPGDVMTGETVGEVVASRTHELAEGDLVVGARGWRTYHVVQPHQVVKLAAEGPSPSTYLGVLGMPGTTAYSGLKDIGQPKRGETLVVAAASGAVGSVVGQLAKREGARVVGIAGGPDKCAFVEDVLDFDASVDHRAPGFPEALAAACPHGIDIYFENVGGAVQAAVFALLNDYARVPMCGMVANYNDTTPAPGPNLGFTIGKRIRIEGFIVSDKPKRFGEWRALAGPWVQQGSLRHREDIVEGLENAPQALIDQLNGRNFGKLLVKA